MEECLWSLDRYEGNLRILIDDNGEELVLPAEALPADAGEGDILRKSPDGYTVDREETQRRRQRVLKLHRRLLDRS